MRIDAKLIRLVNEFDDAAQEFAMKGCAHPDDMDAIEQNYYDARNKLKNEIRFQFAKRRRIT